MTGAIRKVVVVGAGTMGHGIAQVAAMAGADVTLVDRTAELAEGGLAKVRANLEEGVARGKVEASARDAALPVHQDAGRPDQRDLQGHQPSQDPGRRPD